MRSIDLNVSKRDTAEQPKRVRNSGRIPGVFYGAGGPSVAVEVNAHEFGKSGLGSHGAHLISFASTDAGLDKGIALLKEIQAHPVTGTPVHIDFLRIDESKPVTAEVALAFVGKSIGVAEGGMLQPIRRELEVRALPSKLPEQIEVDITALAIGDSVHVEELELGEGVEVNFSENFTLVTILAPVVEKVETEDEGEEIEVAEAAESKEDE